MRYSDKVVRKRAPQHRIPTQQLSDRYGDGNGDDDISSEDSDISSLCFKIHHTKHLVKRSKIDHQNNKNDEDDDDDDNENDHDASQTPISLQNPMSSYRFFVKAADAEWSEKRQQDFLKEKWSLDQYFPIPDKIKRSEGGFCRIDNIADWDGDGIWGEHNLMKLGNIVERWGYTMKDYYDHLIDDLGEQRVLFQQIMTSKDPAVIKAGYQWPYYPRPPDVEKDDVTNKVVAACRDSSDDDEPLIESEYYCAPCDRFIPYSQRHEISDKHPHHAMCWCFSCTARYDRMVKQLAFVMASIARCDVLRRFMMSSFRFEDPYDEDNYNDDEDQDEDEDLENEDIDDDDDSDGDNVDDDEEVGGENKERKGNGDDYM